MKGGGKTVELVVSRRETGKRLDTFLSVYHPDLSRSKVKKLVEKGFVRINSVVCKKPSARVREGDRITLTIPEPQTPSPQPEDIPLKIIFEDEDIAVVEKPCGLVTHPSPGHRSGTLVNALLHHVKNLSTTGGEQRPGIVHRLDKGTAGILVVAKNEKAHASLVRQFSTKDTLKLYRVLVYGDVGRDHGTVELPIGRHPIHRKKFSPFGYSSKPAKSEFWVLERFPALRITLLRLRIYTGRTHQIRVHMSALGYPVLGDTEYGFKNRSVPEDIRKLMGECNMLVAYKLGFYHPSSGEWVEFSIEDPPPFCDVLRKIRELERPLR